MNKINQIKNSVLEKIKPSKKEEEKIISFVDEMKRIVKTISGLDCIACGSIGKFTWLKNNHDIDMFMLFPQSVSREDLEGFGLEYGRKIAKELDGKFLIKYAEHPYVRIKARGFEIDVVPCYRTKSEKIKSAVDRSPHHLQYVLDKLNPTLRNEVRLLKQFCKGIEIYGSDARRMGFSGYICELLVMNYGTFENVLKNVSKWKIPTKIDLEEISKKKFEEPLILVDPTDKNRNAAANVSAENFVKFISKANEFLKNPKISYFFVPEKIPLSVKHVRQLKNRKTKFIAILMKRPDIVDDNLFPQLRKSCKRIESSFKHNDFEIHRSFEFADDKKMILFFEFKIWDLPQIKKMVGPSIFSKKHSKEFLTKYSTVYLENNIWVSEKHREFKDVTEQIKALKSGKDLKERGIPENIIPYFSTCKIVEHGELWKFLEKNKNFSSFLRKKYFDGFE